MTEEKIFIWRAIGFILASIVLPTIAILVSLGIVRRRTPKPTIVAEIARGKKRNPPFGGYTWRVLDVQDDRALLITEDIIEERRYHDKWNEVTWETCALRDYLNGNFFYGKFCAQEQAMILEITNANLDNQWFETKGGYPTKDKVFLLSIEEVVKYFGDSGQLQNKNPESEYWINDRYNKERAAKCNNAGSWWWLRSPGNTQRNAADVGSDGFVNLVGDNVSPTSCGVRPALWLNLA